ncbi:MAG: NTP transferase domain-containing protein [Planctomycetaceae bacterium]
MTSRENVNRRNLFAVIPAAGQSRRMGKPKLLLPLDDETVIARVIRTFQQPEISEVVVVVRAGDVALQEELSKTAATVVIPEVDPPQMRDSIEIALRWIERTYHPHSTDGWILCPADHPLLNREVLAELIAAWKNCSTAIQVPAFEGRRGHPVFFRWSLVDELFSLADDAGVNSLVKRYPEAVTTVEVSDADILLDLDTPEDYDKLCQRQGI